MKNRRRIVNYTFDASAKTVTFTDFTAISLDAILLITNVTDGITIYDFGDPAEGGTVSTNVLTLEHDTTSMADGDSLQIFYDEGDQAEEVITKEFTVTDADGAQTGLVLIAGNSGDTHVVTRCSASIDNACSVDVGVRVGFTSGTLSARAKTGITGIVLSGTGYAAGSGIVEGIGAGKLGEGADGEGLELVCDDPTGGNLTVLVTYYTKKS